MPISSKRKEHRNKVLAYKQRVAGEKKRAQDALIKLYQEQMQRQQAEMKPQVNGVDVENTDINLDDLDVIVEQPVVDVDVSEFTLVEETPVVEETPTTVLDAAESKKLLDEIWESHPNNPKNKVEVVDVVVESVVPEPVKKTTKKETVKKETPKKETPKKKK